MTEPWDDNLYDTLHRFVCGPWPAAGQEFKWRSPDEVKQALKWLKQLDRERAQDKMEKQARRRARIARKSADIVELPPRLN